MLTLTRLSRDLQVSLPALVGPADSARGLRVLEGALVNAASDSDLKAGETPILLRHLLGLPYAAWLIVLFWCAVVVVAYAFKEPPEQPPPVEDAERFRAPVLLWTGNLYPRERTRYYCIVPEPGLAYCDVRTPDGPVTLRCDYYNCLIHTR